MVIEGVLVRGKTKNKIVMKGEEVLWGLGRENAKANSFGQSKRQKEKGEEEEEEEEELCLCDERQWGCCLAKMEFQFEGEFIKDDVCAYVDNIVSFGAYDEFHSVCSFALFFKIFFFFNVNF